MRHSKPVLRIALCSLGVAILSALSVSHAQPVRLEGEAGEAASAYRAGDYDTARSLWLAELSEGAAPRERARLSYNLGNVAFRSGDTAEAIGWYTASLALAPRDADAWANLELARAEAGLEPADRGDLASTVQRVATSMTLAESEWLLFATLGLFAFCLAGEALRGSATWRRLSLLAFLMCGLVAIPWTWNLVRSGRHPMLVVADATAARSEPRPDAKRLEELTLGTEVEKLDELPGWIQVRDPDGERVWVRDNAVFDLAR